MAGIFTSRMAGFTRSNASRPRARHPHEMPGTTHRYTDSDTARRRAVFDRLDILSQLMDSAFVLPGTNIRFGIDGIIGLVPGIGDAITTLMSLYIVNEAHQIGAPKHLILRMLGNVAIDGVVGAVPILGDAFDVAFRANRRNVALLKDYLMRDGIL